MSDYASEYPVTDRQAEVLGFITEFYVTNGYPPTVREIGRRFGISSPNGVQCHVRSLVKKRKLTRVPNQSRSFLPTGYRVVKAAEPVTQENPT